MRVLPKLRQPDSKIQNYQSARQNVPVRDQQPQTETLIAPVRGWVLDENEATTEPGGAAQLDNFFPGRANVELRKGCATHATTAAGKITNMFVYRNGLTEQLFAANSTTIFSATNAGAAATAQSGLTSGDYSYQNFSTPGGAFMTVVNGTDTPKLYNGTVWRDAAITGLGAAKLSHVWDYGKRLWFVEKDEAVVWYLEPDAIEGAAVEFPVRSTLGEGDTLLFGSSFSSDSGSGPSDRLVLVSKTGIVLIYSGIDPLNLQLVGRYKIGRPLGRNAWVRNGGDLLIATDEGLVSLIQSFRETQARLSLTALSKTIEPYWQQKARDLRNQQWQIEFWPERDVAIVTLPAPAPNGVYECLVVNLETQAWARFTRWDIQSLAYFNSSMYFGDSAGNVELMDVGGTDSGNPYTGTCVWSPTHLGSLDTTKTLHRMRSVFRAATPFKYQASAATNYNVTDIPAPDSGPNFASSVWDQALYDQAKWDTGSVFQTVQGWSSIGQTGFSFSPRLQITSGTASAPEVQIVNIKLAYETGNELGL